MSTVTQNFFSRANLKFNIHNLSYLPRWIIVLMDTMVLNVSFFFTVLIFKGTGLEYIVTPHYLVYISLLMGVNVFFSWVQPWLSLDKEDTAAKQALIDKSTKQAQILFYGVSHWRPKSEELGED